MAKQKGDVPMATTWIALIPAYEPTDTLPTLAEELSRAGFTTVVVDDGSGPAYAEIFQRTETWARVLSYGLNSGKGHALKLGCAYIAAHFPGDSVVVTLDCDGQHSVADTGKVAAMAAAHPDTLVLGVRTFGKGTPLRSQLGNRITRGVYRLLTGQKITDTQTGLRGFGMGLLPFLQSIEGERYEYEMNVLMACPRSHIAICEVPIRTIYFDSNRGSHFSTVRDSWRIYRRVLKFAGSSLLSFGVDYGLYSLLTVLFAGLGAVGVPAANVGARIVSSAVNFTVNKRYVFENKENAWKTGIRYFALAACILAGNTLVLSGLVNGLGLNPFAAKILTEAAFFAVSFAVQQCWIFRRDKNRSASAVLYKKGGLS